MCLSMCFFQSNSSQVCRRVAERAEHVGAGSRRGRNAPGAAAGCRGGQPPALAGRQPAEGAPDPVPPTHRTQNGELTPWRSLFPMGFTGFYWVLLGFTDFFTGFSRLLPCLTGFY